MMDLHQFSKFFNEYQQRFIRFATTYIDDRMAVEDIVSESFAYFWDNRQRLPEGTNAPAYVLTVIKHKCIDHLRHEQICRDISDELRQLHSWELSTRIATLENFEPSDVFTAEIQKLVEEALERMPERTRLVFVMSRYENKPHAEIADTLGITVKGVEFHISKATKLLRVILKDYLPSLLLVSLFRL